MGLESTSGSLSQDIVNGGRAARIFEHLQGMAQGQVWVNSSNSRALAKGDKHSNNISK